MPPDASPPLDDQRGPSLDDQRGDPYSSMTHVGLAESDPWDDAPAPPGGAAGKRVRPLRAFLGGVVEVLDIAILAVVMLIGVRFVADNYVVDGPSMEPTFETSEFVIVNRMAYRTFDLSWIPGVEADAWRPFGDPQPGDVIVFTQYSRGIPRKLIKRVIAVEGQTVEVRGGQVIVDGVALDEPYIEEPPSYEYPPVTVEPGMLFVLGDNRNNSADSHNFGPISEELVTGRADVRYWPPGRIGLIEHAIGEAAALAGAARIVAPAWR